ncbi:MAG: fatty acid desaturase [Pedobacter sp.]|jgi:hypothetical protein
MQVFIKPLKSNFYPNSTTFEPDPAIPTGTSGILAIVVAHELIHRKDNSWNFTGRFLLFTVLNPYFYIHHLRIHHKYVGTDSDPVTAKYGESYYHYLVRSIAGQLKQSMQLEKQHCKAKGFASYGLPDSWFRIPEVRYCSAVMPACCFLR